MSGKSTVLNKLQKAGIKRLITNTNRPQRNGEKNHQEYHFVNKQKLKEQKKE